MKSLILASSSPRRIEILSGLNLKFEIVPSNFEEKITKSCSPYQLVCDFSYHKAIDVAKKVGNNKVIIAADTIVFKNEKIFGKPKSTDEAYFMLKELSNCSHEVISGITIIDKEKDIVLTDYEETKVYFENLTDDEIWEYVKTGEPMDKAGAYGIQGLGACFVREIQGCYFNVVGLPVHKLYHLMGKLGVNLLVKEDLYE